MFRREEFGSVNKPVERFDDEICLLVMFTFEAH